MQIKLNNSEIMAILTHIDDVLGYDLEPIERATWLSILGKINGQIQFKHHAAIDEYSTSILNTEYEVD